MNSNIKFNSLNERVNPENTCHVTSTTVEVLMISTETWSPAFPVKWNDTSSSFGLDGLMFFFLKCLVCKQLFAFLFFLTIELFGNPLVPFGKPLVPFGNPLVPFDKPLIPTGSIGYSTVYIRQFTGFVWQYTGSIWLFTGFIFVWRFNL